MSLSADSASQISAMEPSVQRSQFHARNGGRYFRFVSRQGPGAKRRNALTDRVSRYNASWGDKSVQGRLGAMRAVLAILVLCTASVPGKAQAETPADIVARGKALTDAADCASCHTTDPAKPFAGGKRIDTPFGGIYSPDLTPDRDTGLGAWSDDEFYRALHDGVARDGSRYYPAFPYPNFTKITGEDVLAYLATLTPFRNLRQPQQLRWPLNYRVLMRGWNFL